MKTRRFQTVLFTLLLMIACILSPLTLSSCDTEQTDKLVFQLNEDQITYSVVKYTGYGGTVTIPEYYNDMRVTEIKEAAFEGSCVKKVILSESIVVIDKWAFADCASLSKVIMPDTVSEIRYAAFSNTNLKNITLPSALTVLDPYSFSSCRALKKVTYPGTISELNAISRLTVFVDGTFVNEYVEFQIHCSDGVKTYTLLKGW